MADNSLPTEVRIGNADAEPVDWRKSAVDIGPDDDEEMAETPPDVIAALGFDPKHESA